MCTFVHGLEMCFVVRPVFGVFEVFARWGVVDLAELANFYRVAAEAFTIYKVSIAHQKRSAAL